VELEDNCDSICVARHVDEVLELINVSLYIVPALEVAVGF
jgi:hypothetical protein